MPFTRCARWERAEGQASALAGGANGSAISDTGGGSLRGDGVACHDPRDRVGARSMVGPVQSLVEGGELDVHGRTLRVASARQVEGEAQVGVALAKIATLSESPGMPRWTCVPDASHASCSARVDYIVRSPELLSAAVPLFCDQGRHNLGERSSVSTHFSIIGVLGVLVWPIPLLNVL